MRAQVQNVRKGTPETELGAPGRFTIDGDDALEQRLHDLCREVKAGVREIVSARKLEALVLGGGYGRGEGGVLKAADGSQPYNDLEFYVFARGSKVWNQRQFTSRLLALGERLSHSAGLHVEFKTDSLAGLRSAPISMFSYDLVSAHRMILGSEAAFQGCAHHLVAADIPLSEATRLLFNRCSGLLVARELLRQQTLKDEDADFIGRNLAKARLALGDAVLVALKQYHWSARTRGSRLAAWDGSEQAPELFALRQHHAYGLDFKLHPRRVLKTAAEFAVEHREVSDLAGKLWLWIEARRMNRTFASMRDYAFCPANKCPDSSALRNRLLTLRSFGPVAALEGGANRYPRERLFNSLPLLLWNGEVSREPEVRRFLQKQLHSRAADWTGLVAAYKQIWPGYG